MLVNEFFDMNEGFSSHGEIQTLFHLMWSMFEKLVFVWQCAMCFWLSFTKPLCVCGGGGGGVSEFFLNY